MLEAMARRIVNAPTNAFEAVRRAFHQPGLEAKVHKFVHDFGIGFIHGVGIVFSATSLPFFTLESQAVSMMQVAEGALSSAPAVLCISTLGIAEMSMPPVSTEWRGVAFRVGQAVGGLAGIIYTAKKANAIGGFFVMEAAYSALGYLYGRDFDRGRPG